MFGTITQALVKKTIKTATVPTVPTVVTLNGLSTILDKGVELTDDVSEFVDSLGKEAKKENRSARNEKRKH